MKIIDTIKSAFFAGPVEEQVPRTISQSQSEKLVDDQGYDLDFIQAIQPQGGITFDDKNAVAGDGYFSAIDLYTYPENPTLNWLFYLSDQGNSITTIDIGTENTEEVRRRADRTLNELRDQATTGNKTTKRDDATTDYWNVKDFMQSISKDGEIPKKILVRIYVYDPVLEKLEQRRNEIITRLKASGYQAKEYAFIQKEEFVTLHESLTQQESHNLGLKPITLGAATLGGGVPFNGLELIDRKGLPLGRTTTGGPFVFDQFKSTDLRRSFNIMILGKSGMGKSTLIKMLEEGTFARGYYWRGIDKASEYDNLVHTQHGVVINLDGSNGLINPLEIMATVVDDQGNIDEVQSFYTHMDKVGLLFKMINNDELSQSSLNDFRDLLQKFYIAFGLIPHNFNNSNVKFKATGLAPKKYPTMSQFYDWVQKHVTADYLRKIDATENRRVSYENIKTSLQNLVTTYGKIFDGHSSIKNVSNEKVVVYDTSNISKMDTNIYRAQLYMTLSLIWNDALQNGRKQARLLREHKITPDQIEYFSVTMDECHNIINASNPDAVTYVANFAREMRKNYAGMILGTQSLEEIMPDNIADEKLSALRSPFELCQYKVFFSMDNSQMPKVKKLLRESLSDGDYAKIPGLIKGNTIFDFGGREKYHVHIDPNSRQLEVFQGGQ